MSAPAPVPALDVVERALARARGRAREAADGETRWIAVAWDHACAEPSALLDAAPPGSYAACFASEGDTVAGAGVAALAHATGAERFERVDARVRDVFERMTVLDLRRGTSERAPFPRFLGGFGFHDAPAPASLWGGFHGASFVLPSRVEGVDGEGGWRGFVLRTERAVDAASLHALLLGVSACPSAAWGDAGHATFDGLDAGTSTPPPVDPGAWTEHERAAGDYRDVVQAALDRIACGDVSKIVVARSRTARLRARPAPSWVLERLRSTNPAATRFCFGGRHGAAFLGASPERLVRVDGSQVRTVALAGTLPLDASASADQARQVSERLLGSEKDLREHRLVVEGIVGVLTRCCRGVEVASVPGTVRFPGVIHLATPLSARLREGVSALSLVAALHPTPAVGGTPRDAALAQIRALEGGSRGWYAGPVGWIAPQAVEFVVALRSALLHGTNATLFAGAGIVAGSVPDAELRETEAKMLAMRQVMGWEAEPVDAPDASPGGPP